MAENRPIERFPKRMASTLVNGTTLLGITENGTEKFNPQFVAMVMDVPAAVLTLATISIGTNANNYDDILPTTSLLSIPLLTGSKRQQIIALMGMVNANTSIYVKISGISVGTSYTFQLVMYGDYV